MKAQRSVVLAVVLVLLALAPGAHAQLAVSVNDNKVGTSGDVNGACLIDLPSLVHIVCLTADGGAGGNPTDFEAAVLHAAIGG